MDRTNADSAKNALTGRKFDLIIDKAAYASNDVRALLTYADCERYRKVATCVNFLLCSP